MNQQTYLALDWVKTAIDENLTNILQHLSTTLPKVPQGAQATLMQQWLHEVTGALQMTGLTAPTFLAEALELMAQKLTSGALPPVYIDDLIRGLKVLQHALDVIQQHKRPYSLPVYKTLQHIAQLLQTERLASALHIDVNQVMAIVQPQAPLTGSAREMLQRALRFYLLRVSKPQANAEDWVALQRISRYLSQGAASVEEAALWHVVQVWLGEVAQANAPITPEREAWLARLAVAVQQPIVEQAFLQSVMSDFDTLQPFHTADAEQLFARLGWTLSLEQQQVPVGQRRALERVIELIKQAKNNWVRRGQASTDVVACLQDASYLLDVTGWQNYAKQVGALKTQLEKGQEALAISGQFDELLQELTQTSQAVVSQNMTNAEASGDVLANARRAALRETRVALEMIKTQLSQLSVHSAANSLEPAPYASDIPVALHTVQGAFAMLGLTEAAQVMVKIAALVPNVVAIERLHWQQIQSLADMVSGVEYFLDQLVHQYNDNTVLQHIEALLAKYNQLTLIPMPVQVGGAKIYHDEGDTETVKALVATPVIVEPVTAPVQVPETAPSVAPVAPVDVPTPPVVSREAALGADIVLPEDDFAQDQDIQEIFVEEVQEVLESINELMPVWSANIEDLTPLKDIRRGFHTLKGSGRMVGARVLGEMAWSIESLFNRVLDGTIKPTPDMVTLVKAVLGAVPAMLDDYAANRPTTTDPREWMAKAQLLTKGQALPTTQALPQASLAPVTPVVETPQPEIAEPVVTKPAPAAVGAVNGLPAWLNPAITIKPAITLPEDATEPDPEIEEIFLEEATEVLEEIDQNFPVWSKDFSNTAALKEFRRGFHTLKGSGRMVGARVLGEMAWSIENMLNRVLDNSVKPDEHMVQVIEIVLSEVPDLLEDFAAHRPPRYDVKPIIQAANRMSRGENLLH